MVDQTTDGLIRFVTTPATCPRRYGDQSYSPWPWHRSDATALAGYTKMMMDDDDDDDDDDDADDNQQQITTMMIGDVLI